MINSIKNLKRDGYLVCGEFGFYIQIREKTEYQVELDVREITAVGDYDLTLDDDLFLNVILKWDGCMHTYWGDKNSYIHFCDLPTINKIPDLFKEIRRIGKKLMGSAGYDD